MLISVQLPIRVQKHVRHKNSSQVIRARVYVTILSARTTNTIQNSEREPTLNQPSFTCCTERVTNLLSLLPSTKKMPSSGRLVTGCRLTITMLLVVVVPPFTTATKFLTQFLTWCFHARTITEARRDARMRLTGGGGETDEMVGHKVLISERTMCG